MASPPFNLNITIPGDTDIVSQFPGVDRTHLGIFNSWLLTDHNVNGTHTQSTYLQVGVADSGGNTAVAPQPAANNSAIYRDTDKGMKIVNGDDLTVEYMGFLPVGSVIAFAGSTAPQGYALCSHGATLSRTTDARLFAVIGTTYGVGDGTTTFGLPDLEGRTIFGKDSQGRLVTSAYGTLGLDGTTLGAVNSTSIITVQTANLPAYTPSGTININPQTITDPTSYFGPIASGGSSNAWLQNPSDASGTGLVGSVAHSTISTATGTFTGNAQGGSSATLSIVPPGIVLNWLIRR